MRELILLRHAEAQPSQPGGDDLGRRLSGRGEQEARAAGRWLEQWLKRHNQQRPGRVLCSPSERTRATAALALAEIQGAPEPELCEDIYEATQGELLALLDDHGDAESVLLIGHNPGIERLVALLAEGRSDEYRGMPPAGIAVFHSDEGFEPGHARLEAFWSP